MTSEALRDVGPLPRTPDDRAWGWIGLPRATEEHHRTARASAVVVLTRPVGDDLAYLLVRRSTRLRHHAGEFAFPGGGIDPGETPVDAAIRECGEETGVLVDRSLVIGTLPPLYLWASGNVVTPVLARLGPDGHVPSFAHDDEIHSAHWVSRRHLLDPENRTTVSYRGRHAGRAFRFEGTYIWGFTARVLDWILAEVDPDSPDPPHVPELGEAAIGDGPTSGVAISGRATRPTP
ncbi:NUDIX hydrolase [Georgenia sp. Z1344]|uniref:NUDIX hydrolase n=1 Tax=Georgenia sp. Z1344 TaxID=3416706 RepID=UPI003CF107D7